MSTRKLTSRQLAIIRRDKTLRTTPYSISGNPKKALGRPIPVASIILPAIDPCDLPFLPPLGGPDERRRG